MKNLKKATAILLAISLLVLPMPPARADDSDIFGANIEPNVLIVLDTSGSMNDEVGFIAYNPASTYAGSYTSAVVYKKQGSTYNVYAQTIANVSSSAARTALSTGGNWSGRIGGSRVNLYVGNYLNYQACSSCSGGEPKIAIAKRVINNLINNVDGVRFGVMRFVNNGSQTSPPGSGGIVAQIGTAKTTMVTAVNAITASGWTPLGEQMDDVGRYYKGQTLRNGTSYSSPIQYSCQPSFAIVVSDGMFNGLVDPRVEATNRYTQDHSTTYSGLQNVIVHTVGFSIDPDEREQALANLQTMATNGGGSFYASDNSVQLEQALQDAIRQVLAATFSFATPVVPTTGVSGSTRAYLAALQSNPSAQFWRGYLKAYNRDANGQIPVDPTTHIPLDSALAWDAGQRLSVKSAGSRTIYTVVSGVRQSFVKSGGVITDTLLGVSSGGERDKVIDFIRGIDAYDEDADGNTSEERAWKLGDIFHSTPTLVTKPFLPSLDSTYNTFKSNNASRTTILLAGANDGMLHAFREDTGDELWGFIPADQLSRLKDLTARSGEHGYYVDTSPIAADICVQSTTDGTGNCNSASSWKTIVVLGERRGGRSYLALDITDPTNPLYLWSFTDAKMGETWSEPSIGKIKMSDGSAKWVAFIGGGYDTAANNTSGKAFFVIDLATGAKLWEYYNAPSSTDDKQYMNFSLAANPTAVDLDNDRLIDRVYIGDVGGQVWKFDVSGPATLSGGLVTNWTGKRLFTADPSQANPPAAGEYYPGQAVYTRPAVARDTSGNLWVFFGTGDRNHPNNAAVNRFYGFKDNVSMSNGGALAEASPPSPAALTDRTSATGTVTQGWYLRLAANEKVLAASEVFSGTVLFTSFTPTAVVTCGSGSGTALLYAVKMEGGDAAIDLTTGDTLTTVQTASSQAKTIGTGIPSKPVVVLDYSGNQAISWAVTGTTNQQVDSTSLPSVVSKRLVGWREVF